MELHDLTTCQDLTPSYLSEYVLSTFTMSNEKTPQRNELFTFEFVRQLLKLRENTKHNMLSPTALTSQR